MIKDIFVFTVLVTLVFTMLYFIITRIIILTIKYKDTEHVRKMKKEKKETELDDNAQAYLKDTINRLTLPTLELDKDWEKIIEQLKGLHYVSKIYKEDEQIKFYKYQNIFKEINETVKHSIQLHSYNNVDLINTIKSSLELPVEEILNGDVTTRIITKLKKETELMETIKGRSSKYNL